MKVRLSDGRRYKITLVEMSLDLEKDGYKLVDLNQDSGELRIRVGDKVEIWQMRPPGEGCDNTIWGDYPHGFEFCRSE